MSNTYRRMVVDSWVAGPFKMTLLENKYLVGFNDYYEIVIAADGAIWNTVNVRGDEAAAREAYEKLKPKIATEVAKRALRVRPI